MKQYLFFIMEGGEKQNTAAMLRRLALAAQSRVVALAIFISVKSRSEIACETAFQHQRLQAAFDANFRKSNEWREAEMKSERSDLVGFVNVLISIHIIKHGEIGGCMSS